MAFNWDEWQFTRDADPPITSYPWWMDRRHTERLYRIAHRGGFHRILEIGCHHGSSTSALVSAINDGAEFDLHLCDPDRNAILDRVIGQCKRPITYHQCCSLRVIPLLPWDLVIVDGDHSLKHVSRELGLLLYHEVPFIVAHDIEARMIESCAGAVMLGDVLRAHPAYRCEVDSEPRAGEYTERGLMIARR